MFISYKQIGLDRYKIIDSDFEEIVNARRIIGHTIYHWVEDAVIDLYEQKGLPVAPNLIKAMIYRSTSNPRIWQSRVEQILAYGVNRNPKFVKYKSELERYMLIL